MNYGMNVHSLLCIVSLAFIGSIRCQEIPAHAELLDTIHVVLYAQEGAEIVTLSDVRRPSLSGQPRTQEDIIFEQLINLDAKKHKVQPTEEEVDRYLNAIQRDNNITAEQLEQVFASVGFTKEEGRGEIARMNAVNTMMDYKIRSNLVVPRKEVEEYYQANPQYTPDERIVEQLYVPYAKVSDTDAKEAITNFIKKGTGIDGVSWSSPFSITREEIAAEKEFIFSMKRGEVSEVEDNGSGYETYRIVEVKEPRLLTLDERYMEIVSTLRQPLYEQKLQEYKDKLYSSAAVVNIK